MPSVIYNSFWDDKDRGNINMAADQFFRMIVGPGYVENKDTHQKRSDVTAEISGGGYTAGGVQVTPTITKDTATDRQVLTFPAGVVPGTGVSGAKEVVYKRRGGAASADELVYCNDFGGSVIGPFAVGQTTITLQN